MAKVLITVHLGRHFRIFGHYDYQVLLKMGHEVHIAANFIGDIDNFDHPDVVKHQIDFERSPFSLRNARAIKQLISLLNRHKFDIIHTQSPVGGVCTRLAGLLCRQNKTRMLYTPHGLHFFSGSPLLNWLLYFPIEVILSIFTDRIITINEEDFGNAKKYFFSKQNFLIHGVGVDLLKYQPQTFARKLELRSEYGYSHDDFILIYAGELSYRKHQDLLFKAISILKSKIPCLRLLLAGTGELRGVYEQQVERLGIVDHVFFLGYRSDVINLMNLSDVCVSSSRQEGLPVNILEAMATGLPLVVTDCRGNRDLIRDGVNGFVVGLEDENSFARSVETLYQDPEMREKFREMNLKIIQEYSLARVESEMKVIYGESLMQ